MTLDPAPASPAAGSPLSNALALGRWDTLTEATERHGADRVLIQSLDHVLSPLATRRPLPARLGGILFRPTLHYPDLGSPPDSLAGWARHMAKTALTRAALRHPSLSDVFSLDPSAVPALARSARGQVHALPDPVSPEPPDQPPATVRERYGVQGGRALVVMAGTLDDRKGVHLLLRALATLDAPAVAQTAVLLAGRVAVDDRPAFERDLAAARAGGLPVLLHDDYLSPGALAALVAAADLLVLPYDRHVGSSGFLVRAAAAGTPVLTQRYGWMGHAVRTHGLGWTASPAHPETFAEALVGALEAAPPSAEAGASFVATHTVDAFAAPLLSFLAP